MKLADPFQSYYRAYKRTYEEQPPKLGRLFKEQDTHNSGAYSAYPGPYCISSAYGYGLYSFVEQVKAQADTDKKANAPANVFKIVGKLEAGSKAYFEKPCENKYQPVHAANIGC